MGNKIDIKLLVNESDLVKYRYLRWEVFRKPHDLPLGSEFYEGEELGICVGIIRSGDIVGGALVLDRGNGNGQLHQMVVEQSEQGIGIGARLLAEIENYARDADLVAIFAHARVHVASFYQKYGYSTVVAEAVPPGLSSTCAPGIPHLFLVKKIGGQLN